MTTFPTPVFPTNEIQPTDATHFQILWSGGSTEGGSSGSPLIDTTTRRVVGVLSGGFASCANPTGYDYYGRLSAVRPVYCMNSPVSVHPYEMHKDGSCC